MARGGLRLGHHSPHPDDVADTLTKKFERWWGGYSLTSAFRYSQPLEDPCDYLASATIRNVPTATVIARAERRADRNR